MLESSKTVIVEEKFEDFSVKDHTHKSLFCSHFFFFSLVYTFNRNMFNEMYCQMIRSLCKTGYTYKNVLGITFLPTYLLYT